MKQSIFAALEGLDRNPCCLLTNGCWQSTFISTPLLEDRLHTAENRPLARHMRNRLERGVSKSMMYFITSSVAGIALGPREIKRSLISIDAIVQLVSITLP